jgi:hypothetical protein
MNSKKKYTEKAEISRKIYCANCSHCVLIKQQVGHTSSYVLRVRCNMGMWKKRSGGEKIYKYFTIVRRTMVSCKYYDAMGDEKTFIKELRKSLPIKDEIYSY